MMSKEIIKIALVGNPNSGKSTLFNVLTGLNQSVGNYPGITVDKKTGISDFGSGNKAMFIDLPGSNSLFAKSLDEKVTQKVLLDNDHEDNPNTIVFVADASNLRKSLFFLSQIKNLDIP